MLEQAVPRALEGIAAATHQQCGSPLSHQRLRAGAADASGSAGDEERLAREDRARHQLFLMVMPPSTGMATPFT